LILYNLLETVKKTTYVTQNCTSRLSKEIPSCYQFTTLYGHGIRLQTLIQLVLQGDINWEAHKMQNVEAAVIYDKVMIEKCESKIGIASSITTSSIHNDTIKL